MEFFARAREGAGSGSLDEIPVFCYPFCMNEHSSDNVEPPSPEPDPFSCTGAVQKRLTRPSRDIQEARHGR